MTKRERERERGPPTTRPSLSVLDQDAQREILRDADAIPVQGSGLMEL